MKKHLTLLLVIISLIKVNGQEYEFINQTITLISENSIVPKDSVYLNKKFIVLGNEYMKTEYLNEKTIRFWWKNSNSKSPVELFLSNFNFDHLKTDILKSKNDSIVDFEKLQKYFFEADNEFIKKNPKKKYLQISKPFFNCNNNWCFIVKSEFIPHTNIGGNKLMYIYVNIKNEWILYNILNLSTS